MFFYSAFCTNITLLCSPIFIAKRKGVPCLIINLFVFRVDPAYMYYYIHWTRLLCTGIIPFSYLSYMNLRIYTRIRQTSLSTVRSRSSSSKKASNLAAVLIVIGESCSSHKVGGTFYLIRYKKSIFLMAKIRKILRKKFRFYCVITTLNTFIVLAFLLIAT